MSATLLLIEDDPEIRDMASSYLTREGYRIIEAGDGSEALQKFGEQPVDLVLLDLMLPKLNGLELLKRLRELSRVPIVILSAKDGEADKALGLRFGADDYIAKPFSLIELTARVEAAIRRATQYSSDSAASGAVIAIGDLCVDCPNLTASKRGTPLKLTAKEFQILKLFAEHPQRVYTKAMIYQHVWQDDYYSEENVINVHIRRLREKIEDDPSNPRYIQTIWGIGYKWGSDV